MKPLPLLLIAALTPAACVTSPQEQAAKHQQELREEAQEKFDDEKDKEKEAADDARERAAEDAKKRAEDIADARQRAADDAAKYKAYEEEYARQLGKKPSQLTPEERKWVRNHYNN